MRICLASVVPPLVVFAVTIIVTWRDSVPHLEDLGSGFGTRLNGETLFIGHAAQLTPGDHIWLGGCVLAYDIEL